MPRDKGQSTIEFLSALSFVLAIIFFYVKMALNITNGYLMHYATFMASRAYLVGDDGGTSDAGARGSANAVFSSISAWALGIEQGGNLNFNTPQAVPKKVFVGAWTSFKQKFSYSAIVGGTALMNYISESFIGREPTTVECIERVCTMVKNSTGMGNCDLAVTAVDNGC